MQSTRDIKNRIKSISNTKQIAKAMEVVSATKMKKAQDFAISARPFAKAIFKLIADLPEEEINNHPLYKTRPLKRELLIIITSDKGLAGVYNANVLKNADKYIKETSQNHAIDIITVGKKAKEYYKKRGANIIKEYQSTGDYAQENQARHISDYILNHYTSNAVDKVNIIFTRFISTLRQGIAIEPVLPHDAKWLKDHVSKGTDSNTDKSYERIIEPSKKALLDIAMPYIFHLHFFQAILEANASEHSARMIAMKKASDNAGEIISELTLEYNKSRQAGITQELIEIISGTQAV